MKVTMPECKHEDRATPDAECRHPRLGLEWYDDRRQVLCPDCSVWVLTKRRTVKEAATKSGSSVMRKVK